MPAASALSFRWSGSELEGARFTPGLRVIGRMKKRKSVCGGEAQLRLLLTRLNSMLPALF